MNLNKFLGLGRKNAKITGKREKGRKNKTITIQINSVVLNRKRSLKSIKSETKKITRIFFSPFSHKMKTAEREKERKNNMKVQFESERL